MPNEKLARRYATAVFEVAAERDAVERIGRDLHALRDAIAADETTARFFAAPIVDRYEKERALAAAFDGKVDDVALHTLLLLVRKHREALLPELLVQYDALQTQARGLEPLSLATAKPMSDADLRALVARLEAIYGKKFDVTASVDPSAIGGVRITMGDKRVDGTIAGRLDDLSRALFAQNPNA